MIRLRLWLARLLLPRGWGVAHTASGWPAHWDFACDGDYITFWPHDTSADTLTQEQVDSKEPEKS